MALSGWAIFLILLILAVVLGAGGYVAYTHYRANRLGLPPPSLNPFNRRTRASDPTTYRPPAPAPGGLRGWITDTWHGIRNPRSATGAYESHTTSNSRTGYSGGGRRGFGPLDPDEAWDARVQDEGGVGGYYEEQELGDGPYGGGGYGVGRGLEERYDEEMHGGARVRVNPFGEQAEESSMRSLSPRPYVETGKVGGGAHHQRGQSSLGTTAGSGADESPTERRSMFHEDV